MSSSSAPKAKRKKKVARKIFDHLPSVNVSAHMRRLLYLYLACVIVSALAAAIFATTQRPAPLPDPFSAQQRTVVNFQLYYPTSLPTPFYVDIASLGRTEQTVVAMRITDGRGKGQNFTISQQRLPESVDLEALHQSFSGRTGFKTGLGQATTGTIDDGATRIVSLVTEDKTWVLLQAPAEVSLSVLQESLQSLTPSR